MSLPFLITLNGRKMPEQSNHFVDDFLAYFLKRLPFFRAIECAANLRPQQ